MTNWLDIARNQAEERFRSLPAPTTNDENFRFTTLSVPAALAADGGRAPLASSYASLDEDEAAVLLIQGEEAELKGATPGFLFTDAQRAAVLGSEPLRSRFKDSALFAQDKFAQLSAARWSNGAFLHVPAGVKIEKPVRSSLSFSAGEEHARHLIVLEDGAEAVWVQESLSGDDAAHAGELTEIRLGKGAKLHWVSCQQLGRGTQFVARQKLELGEGAELKVTSVQLGSAVAQIRQEAVLAADSVLDFEGAARGDSNQHFDFWLDVDHQGSRSTSETKFGFVMSDQSRAVFNGLIHIRKDAAETNAGQKSKSLLMSPKATVHAIPKLIIQTDNVKCSHGASVSTVNPEQIHYLRSRGIPRPEAERMIVRGFTEAVLQRLPTEALYSRVEAALDGKQGGRLQ